MGHGVCHTLQAGHKELGVVEHREFYPIDSLERPRIRPDEESGKWRIRKLTPKECWRLMGFDDADFEKAEQVVSKTQLYKQAGNSIVVDVLENIFRQLTDRAEHIGDLMLYEPKWYVIDRPIRLIELFAGIGSQAKRMKRLRLDYEAYRVCEWDKYCIRSYNAIHGTDFETSDITKLQGGDLGIVNTEDYCYVMTYSFPCQDLSVAGKGAGMTKGTGTRSGLLWEVERLLNETEHLPQVLVMENVPQVHNKKNIADFNKWQEYLTTRGYRNYWQDLNAKNYGVPQNRDRCFMVSILGDYDYEFPKPFRLQLRLKDMLEERVDESYYLPDERLELIENWQNRQIEKGNGFRFEPTDGGGTAKPITTNSDRPALTTYIKDDGV